jgi:hypothetical protein
MCKILWARGAGGGQSGAPALGRSPTAGRPATQRPAVAGPPTAALGGRPRVVACLYIFFYLFFKKKGDIFIKKKFRPLHVARAWTSNGGVCTVSHFLKCAPILGSANSSKIHGEWRFHFFPKKNFLNLLHTWTFISAVGIFVS